MSELNEGQIIRLYSLIDFGKNENIERAFLGKNRIEITIRDTKRATIRSYNLDLKNDLKTLDFIVNGIRLERE